MRLTRVEIHGFKSFADRTALELPSGLTAVVGPNGCGKSNIIDAIKWALGEQRAGALRGDEMLDVIFKGNGARPARNFAEVSMVFDNADRALPVEFTEVVVTRRLFKSGDSEYLINKRTCRLKDVRDLFLDTGLGRGSYAIMEQGRIDAVLSADPADRRRIFEEAAGIARYRARRRESESKLERTEQNLLRLGDLVDELEKRQRSLKYQAGRARSYIEARDRVRELKSLDAAHKWRTWTAQLAELAGEVERAGRVEAEARAALGAARQEQEALQARLDDARRGVDAAAEEFRKATVAVDALGERQASLRERLAESAGARERAGRRAEDLQAALAERQREAAAMAERVEQARVRRDELTAAATRAEGALERARAALSAWDAEADTRRGEALQRVQRLTDARNERAEADSARAAAAASHERLIERVQHLRAEAEVLQRTQGELFAGVRDLDAVVERQQRSAEQIEAARAAAADDLARCEGDLAGGRERLAGLRSRHQALSELIARRDGVTPGAVQLLDAGLPGVAGLLVDALKVPRDLAAAVEAVLGPASQGVVVDTTEHALGALAALRERGGGRALLLPRDRLAPRRGAAGGPRLLDRLDAGEWADVAEALLGHARLVQDASGFADCPVDGVTVFVTPSGELRDAQGAVAAGRPGDGSGLVTRRAECAALGEEAVRLEERLAGLGAERERAEQELQGLSRELHAAQSQARRAETERERARERERHASERRQALARDLGLREQELAAVAGELAAAGERLQGAQGAEAELAVRVEQDRESERARQDERSALVDSVESAQSGLSSAQSELSTWTERVEALTSERRQIERAVEERRAEAAGARAELADLDGRIERLAADGVAAEERGRLLGDERDAAAGVLQRARDEAGRFHEHIERAAAAVASAEEALQRAGEGLSEARLKRQEVEIHREDLRQRVREELEIDFAERAPQDDDGRRDWTAIEAELEDLRGRLARMGNVNMEAIDELAAVEERLGFLTAQRDDMLGAKKSLAETIARVNRESRERFLASFEEIRAHFRTIFRKLFQGGRADVFLEEGVDVLDAGIEIVAAPPGKDQRSISLLSGGERTLTAVGLLFALFRARPSPVCLLDEVDAALDETNIDRFCSVLEDFLAQSQFIVVTHARRTMSYADTLYGVTMQEHGVSKVLSVTLAEAERRGELHERGSGDVATTARAAGRRVVAEAVALDGAARDGAARDGAVRDGAARDGAARDGAARDGIARDGAPRDGTVVSDRMALADGSRPEGALDDGESAASA